MPSIGLHRILDNLDSIRQAGFRLPGNAELERYRQQPALYEENRLYGDLGVGLFTADDFNHAGEIHGWGWSDREAVRNRNLSGLPDLKDSEWVLKQQHLMVDALVSMGFDGFRLDACKHITERMIDYIADRPEMRNKFRFGEVITGSGEGLNPDRSTCPGGLDFVVIPRERCDHRGPRAGPGAGRGSAEAQPAGRRRGLPPAGERVAPCRGKTPGSPRREAAAFRQPEPTSSGEPRTVTRRPPGHDPKGPVHRS